MFNVDFNEFDKEDMAFAVKCFTFLLLMFLLMYTANADLSTANIYYSYNDDDLTGSNPLNLSGTGNGVNTNANTGRPGILEESFNYVPASTSVVDTNTLYQNDFTMLGWFNTSATGINAGILGAEQGGIDGFKFWITSGNQLQISVSNGGRTAHNIGAVSEFNDGDWHHFFIRFDNGPDRWEVWIDGQIELNVTQTMAVPTNTIDIGMCGACNNYWNGEIDETGLYENQLLPIADVNLSYNGGSGFNPYAPQTIIQSNLSSFYATESFGLNVSTTDGLATNMSYILDGGSEVFFANNTNETTLSFTSISIGSHNLSFKANTSGSIEWTNQTFEIQPYQYFRFNDTTSGSLVNNFTFGGVTSVGSLVTLDTRNYTFGSQTLNFTKEGYIVTGFDVTFNNTMQLNITYQIRQAEIIVTIKDRDNLSTISSQNFSLEFIGPTGFNTNTITGTKTIEGTLSQGDYELLVSNSNYTSEFKYFTFTNQEQLNLTVYTQVVNATNTGFVTINVIDVDGQPIPNAIVSSRQWNSATSSYISVGEETTTNDGLANLNVILNTKQYIFRATKNNEVVDSVPQIISTTDSGKTITLTLSAGIGNPFKYFAQGLNYNASNFFNDTSNISTVTFEWNKLDGTNVVACVNAYRTQFGSEILLGAINCTTASSGQIIRNFAINTTYDLYLLKAELRENNIYYPVETFRIYSDSSIIKQFENYQLHYLILIFMHIMSIAAAIRIESIALGSIGLIISSLVAIALAPTLMTTTVAMFLSFVGVVVLIGGAKQ